MLTVKSEPWEFASLGELLAIAGSMEQEAIEGYVALSKRMAGMDRPDLAQVFDSLVLEEKGHLQKVEEWRDASAIQRVADVPAPKDLYDDELAGLIAPELLTAYRAFSMAVRNEERAFTFWTYVSANAQSDEIKRAAESMAREELGHVAKLRRERRKAFHSERAEALDDGKNDMKSLEAALAGQLDIMAAGTVRADVADLLRGHAREARARMDSIMRSPLVASPLRPISFHASGRVAPMSEHLLDCYLDIGDHATSEHDAGRARAFAAQLIACLRTVKSVGG